MKINEIITVLEKWAPTNYAEDFDNVGLLVGNINADYSKALITLDTTEAVVDEAIRQKCQLIISFHPIIFSGLKKITGNTYVERVVVKAIQNNIALYAIHTALDNHKFGVSHQMGVQLGLKKQRVLIPQKETLRKLTTYVPTSHSQKVLNALYEKGAGAIGAYKECSFSVAGTGTFTGNSESNPVIGTQGKAQKVEEKQISVVFKKHLKHELLKALKSAHPYEEVAYEVSTLENLTHDIGMGSIGELETPMEENAFFSYIKKQMHTPHIRHSKWLGKPILKVALLGGSGSFAIAAAKRQNADILITADLKYHNFFEAENKIILADIGHYESEQFTKKLIADYLTKKMPNFAYILSNEKTNPVNYF